MQLVSGYNLGGINVHVKQVVTMKTTGQGYEDDGAGL